MVERHYLDNIKDDKVRDVIKERLYYANKIGIKICIDLVEEILHLKIDSHELIQILEILLDNAIEAAGESSERIIKFGIIKEERNIMIIVANSFENNVPIFKMYKEGFTTKENKSGVGLNKLKSILKKYDNAILDTIINSQELIQIITIE